MASFDNIRANRTPEFKARPIDTKAVDPEARTVTTLYSVAGNVDSYDDRMWPGAFQQTFAQRGNKVLHLWQHDFTQPPIAIVKSLRELTRDELPPEVLRDYPDAQGGAEAVSEFLTTPRAEEVFKALLAGSPLEASFGFDVVRSDFTQEGEKMIRNIREVRLWEVSTVLWGANSATLGAKAHLAPDVLLKHLTLWAAELKAELKAGNRHSTHDYDLIDQIAAAAVDLGARNVKLAEAVADDSDEKSRAASLALTLKHRSQSLALLDF